jgi:DNA anti-recombination protein RmuC
MDENKITRRKNWLDKRGWTFRYLILSLSINLIAQKMNREELKAKSHKAINKLFSQLDELDAKKDELSAKAKAEYADKREALAKKKEELQARYKELEGASGESIDDLKVALDKSAESFKEAFGNIKTHFKKEAKGGA